jgi:GTPase SAR1 family protein
VVVIGDISVGKTNIIKRLMGEEFIPVQATIGVDFTYVENSIEDEDNPNKKNKISLQIWDTCNSKYKNIIFN